MIRVVQLQISTESAGRSALRLHNALVEAKYNSSIVSLRAGVNEDEFITHLGIKPNFIAWLDTKLESFITRKNNKQFGLFSYPILGTDVSNLEQIQNADIIYLHWVQGGFLSLANIEQLAKSGKPIIIIMHDMWPLTGGCHYSFECKKYIVTCNDCQMIPKHKINDLSTHEFHKKMKLFSKYNNFYFISPSIWLYNCALESFLLKNKPVYYIPNIIDNSIFKPFDKKLAKQILNIDSNKQVIAFGAVSIDSPYKGRTYLQKALELLKEEINTSNTLVLIFGSVYNKKIAAEIPFETKFMGYLRDEYSLILVYNSVDVFVVPSLADNQPTTIMESLCCGTAVVGFEIGGIPDMINHKENGYIAKYKDAEDIANGIKFCLENKIKGYILPNFEKNIVREKHINLIKSILDN